MVEAYGRVYRWEILCSIDFDPVACRNHDLITGEKTAVQMDLFNRDQYRKWFGHEPPPEWREVTPRDIWEAFQKQVPDYIFLSPPCKGFSGLLPEKSARSEKYQALNLLAIRGLELALEACRRYGDGEFPAFVHFENVPRITSRGADILKRIKQLLERYGYVVDMRADHNLGEIGGLGQNRLRFLLLARNQKRVPNWCYLPPKKQLRTIGDVLGPLPLPDDPAGGPMHRLPRLQWKTWVRLALIPAGGDWRDLNRLDWQNYRIVHEPRGGAYAVEDWNQPSRTVTGTAGPGRSNGAAAVADPRIGLDMNGHAAIYRVSQYDEPAPCVTGAHRPNNGAIAISDPRLNKQEGKHPGVYRIVRVDEPAPCVTGTRFGSGAIAVADPRMNCTPRSGTMGVQRWDEPGKTVIGAGDIHAGAAAVADPRIPADDERGVWVIISEDGTWHRPLTTYELAMIQGFPRWLPDGRPFQLENCSDAKAREYIGNAVPPAAMAAMGNVILSTMMLAEAGAGFELSWNEVWVRPEEEELPTVVQ
jgi:site-specific DNA-cytosine methylase